MSKSKARKWTLKRRVAYTMRSKIGKLGWPHLRTCASGSLVLPSPYSLSWKDSKGTLSMDLGVTNKF